VTIERLTENSESEKSVTSAYLSLKNWGNAGIAEKKE